MSSPNQYLVYTALVLGSIGAYGTLNVKSTKNVDDLLSDALNNSDVSSTDLTNILDGISTRLGDVENTMSTTSMGTRLSDVEEALDTLGQNFNSVDGKADENTSDIAFMGPDFQDQITTNKTAADAIGTTADTNLSTITDIINPDLETLFGDVKDLHEADVGLDTRIGAIEGARILEATERSTMSGDIGTNATDITTNLESIGAIETALEEVYTAGIDANEANIIANRDDHTYLTDVIRRVEEVDDAGEVVDEYVVCYPKFKAENVELALQGNSFRLGDPLDDDWMFYKAGSGENAPAGRNFSGQSARIRVSDGSNAGFVVENSSNKALFSVKGQNARAAIYGSLDVHVDVHIRSNADGHACFSHLQQYNSPALMQKADGNTVVDSTKAVRIHNKGVSMLEVDANKTTIHKEIVLHTGDASVLNSHFNYAGKGTNWFSAKSTNNFRFGTNKLASVVIKDKEVVIDEVGVLEKLKALEERIKTLEKTCVKHSSEINLRNLETGQFIYVTTKDKTCEARGEHSYQTRGRFTVNLR